MLKKIALYPVVWVFSIVGEITRSVGKILPISRFYRWVFDTLIGIEEGRQWRDDHVAIVAHHVAENDIASSEPKEDLATEVESNWQQTEKHLSNGESVLGLGIAGASFFASPWVAGALAILLIISVSVRLTAVEALAYTNTHLEKSPERLKAEAEWNGGVLDSTRVTSNMLALRIMREIDERFYELWLNEVFGPVLSGERSTKEAVKLWWDEAIEIMVSNTDADEEELKASEEPEHSGPYP